MRKTILILLIFMSNKPLSAQVDSGFIKCGSELIRLVKSMNSFDTDIEGMNSKLISEQKKWVECIKDKIVPDINALSVTSDSFYLSKVKDTVIVLNFWSTSCVPCIAEIAVLNQLNQELSNKEVLFISLCIDSKARFKNNNLPSFLTIDKAEDIFNSYGIISYPQTFVLSKNHRVSNIISGATISDIEKTKSLIALDINIALNE